MLKLWTPAAAVGIQSKKNMVHTKPREPDAIQPQSHSLLQLPKQVNDATMKYKIISDKPGQIEESYSLHDTKDDMKKNIPTNIPVTILEVSFFTYKNIDRIKVTYIPRYKQYIYSITDYSLNTDPPNLITKNKYIIIKKPTDIYVKKKKDGKYFKLGFTNPLLNKIMIQ
jgi:hypothetical protein